MLRCSQLTKHDIAIACCCQVTAASYNRGARLGRRAHHDRRRIPGAVLARLHPGGGRHGTARDQVCKAVRNLRPITCHALSVMVHFTLPAGGSRRTAHSDCGQAPWPRPQRHCQISGASTHTSNVNVNSGWTACLPPPRRHHRAGNLGVEPVVITEAVAQKFITTLTACLLPPRRRHQAGNLGVEHAAPDAVQRALATARLSQPERKEFDREDLVALGLFTPMGAAQAEAQVRWDVNRMFTKC